MTERGPYKMRTIARLTDFSPALLRAWERRHDLLHPMRGPGGHRLYTEEDLRVLRRVKELIQSGRSIGEIASVGRDELLSQSPARSQPQAVAAPLRREEPTPELRDELERQRQIIVQAALQMDSGALNRALDEVFSRVSPDVVIFEVIQPCCRQIGDLWMTGKCSVASEHLASGIFVHRLRKLVESAEPSASDMRPIIVCCFPDEYHQLGALVVAYQLCRHGLRVNFLGAALPFEDLEGACQVVQPAAVMLSVTRQAVYQVHRRGLHEVLRRLADKAPIYIGGQGAPREDPALSRTNAKLVAVAPDPVEALTAVIQEIRSYSRTGARF